MTDKELQLFHRAVYWLRTIVATEYLNDSNRNGTKKCIQDIDKWDIDDNKITDDDIERKFKHTLVCNIHTLRGQKYSLEKQLNEAISLLKQCVNYNNDPMRTGIGGELEEKIREFIRGCEE